MSALLVSLGIGIPLGAYAAQRRRTGRDYSARLYANIAYCIPVFWMGLMLQLVFGVWLGWFPIAGRTGARVDVSAKRFADIEAHLVLLHTQVLDPRMIQVLAAQELRIRVSTKSSLRAYTGRQIVESEAGER